MEERDEKLYLKKISLSINLFSLSLSLPIYIIMKVGAVMNCEKDKMKNVKSVTTSGNIQC